MFNKKKFKRIIRKIKRLFGREIYVHRLYINMLDHMKIKDDVIILESQHGTSLGGNIAMLLKTLCEEPEYDYLKIYVTVRKNNVKALSAQWSGYRNASRITPVEFGSLKYFTVLAGAHYLINDNTFNPIFTKRPGQIYLNTWHGTPLKTLGRAIKGEAYSIGNAQRNFLMADMLLYPNEHTRDVMLHEYMVENFGTGRIVMTGYPRNEVFFDDQTREDVRERYNMGSKKVYAYLPTWRGIVGRVAKAAQLEEIGNICDMLDSQLPDDCEVYVKLHPILRGEVQLDGYRHLRTFPDDVPSYDFLQATDGLITDYSSIMFDYAVTGRKIILFTYDEEEYLENRGLTFSLDELPFPRVATVEDLATEMLSPKNYDDAEFLKRFCPYERQGVTKELLSDLIGEHLDKYPLCPSNGKKNVVIFGGNFIKNGIATALINLLNMLDTEKYNYMVLYRPSPKMQNKRGYHEPDLDNVPDNVAMLGMTNPKCGTAWELASTKLWKKLQRTFPGLPYGWVKSQYERMGRRDAAKTFGNARIDAVVQYNGYFPDVIMMFKEMKCGCSIFVHNDMNGENKKSFAVPMKLLADAYGKYDEVVCVTKELVPSMERFMEAGGVQKREFSVALNLIDYRTIKEKGELPLTFDRETVTTVTQEELEEILSGPEKKFINVGRFSFEKGHRRLIEAFEQEFTPNDNVRLIILGSYGPVYDEINRRAAESPMGDKITVVKFLRNPYALIKQCDYFVLSSLYEGFGLVLCEADILGLPCFSTRITGPTSFMEKYGGLLVDDSVEGIRGGLRDCYEGRVNHTLTCDYAEYNREALAEFEGMLDRLINKGEQRA